MVVLTLQELCDKIIETQEALNRENKCLKTLYVNYEQYESLTKEVTVHLLWTRGEPPKTGGVMQILGVTIECLPHP